MDDVTVALRALHGPVGDIFPTCTGCDAEGFDAAAPSWPCRTAELLYAAEEIAAVRALSDQRLAERTSAAHDPGQWVDCRACNNGAPRDEHPRNVTGTTNVPLRS